MRGFCITFLPLLAAAALALWGGERLARREVETRIPIDRERLHDFADALRGELDRLDQLYQEHLENIAGIAPFSVPDAVSNACRELGGTRECHVFHSTSKLFQVAGSLLTETRARLPEIEIDGGKRPLNLERAVILPRSLLESEEPGASGVILSADRNYRIQWIRPDKDHLVAFTVDATELRQRLDSHFAIGSRHRSHRSAKPVNSSP